MEILFDLQIVYVDEQLSLLDFFARNQQVLLKSWNVIRLIN